MPQLIPGVYAAPMHTSSPVQSIQQVQSMPSPDHIQMVSYAPQMFPVQGSIQTISGIVRQSEQLQTIQQPTTQISWAHTAPQPNPPIYIETIPTVQLHTVQQSPTHLIALPTVEQQQQPPPPQPQYQQQQQQQPQQSQQQSQQHVIQEILQQHRIDTDLLQRENEALKSRLHSVLTQFSSVQREKADVEASLAVLRNQVASQAPPPEVNTPVAGTHQRNTFH